MSFGAPWFLLGALGAAIPVLIHLYGQRRARRVPFPSLMLLQRAEKERSSLSRLRQVWLMLLRALTLLCLALALAQPSLTGLRLPGAAGAPVALLLDDSLSMQAKGPARSAYDVARRAAGKALEELPTGQTVAVYGLTRHEASLEFSPTGRASGALDAARASLMAVDIPAALGRLWARAGSPEQHQTRWVLLTDLQASGWHSALSPPERVRQLTVVDCGADGPNAAVTGLEAVEPPALVDRPLRLRVTVRARPDLTAGQPLEVRVTINRKALPPALCRLVGGKGEALVEWTPQEPGDLQIRAGIPADRLEADNTAHLAVQVRRQLRVMVVGSETQTRWLRLALSPTPGSPVRAQQAAIATEDALDGQDVVVLVSDTSTGSQAAIKAFIERGGGVVLCLPTWGSGLRVPLNLEGEEDGPVMTPSSPVRIGSFDGFRPPLQAFANAAAGDLREPVFRRYAKLTIPPDSPWRVLARFTDQTPALVAGQVGRGRVLLANFALDAASTDLTSLPVFVPLVHRLVGHVARGVRPDQTTCLVGQMVDALSLEGGVVGSESPRDTRLLPGTNPGLRPDRPGFHDLRWQEVPDRQVVAHLAANLDPLETDLRRLSAPELRQRCAPLAVTVCRPDELAQALPASAILLSTPLWVLGLVLLVLELLLLRRPRDGGTPP